MSELAPKIPTRPPYVRVWRTGRVTWQVVLIDEPMQEEWHVRLTKTGADRCARRILNRHLRKVNWRSEMVVIGAAK